MTNGYWKMSPVCIFLHSKQERSVSLIQSTVSMKSDASIERPPNINGEMPPEGKSDFGDIMGSMEYSWSPSTEKWRNMVTSQTRCVLCIACRLFFAKCCTCTVLLLLAIQ